MPSFTASVAAATAVIGADLFVGTTFARSPRNRTVDAIAMAGSAVIGDTEIDLLIDEQRIGNFFNTRLGFPNFDDAIDLRAAFIPAGAQLRAIVRDAATTNPINVRVDLTER